MIAPPPSSRSIRIKHRESRFPPTFDSAFAADDIEFVRTPLRAPVANAYAERGVGSVRAECLDHRLIASEAHLWRALTEYAARRPAPRLPSGDEPSHRTRGELYFRTLGYFNQGRPHQGIRQHIHGDAEASPAQATGVAFPVLGSLQRAYRRAA